jgi:hypothetical protein
MRQALCPEVVERDALDDSAFWGRVHPNLVDLVDDCDQDDLDDLQPVPQSCLVCGAIGACMYDAEGEPLIHADVAEGAL